MKSALALACAALALGALSSAGGADASPDFAAREALLVAARDDAATTAARSNAARSLAKFYAEGGLYLEALSAMQEIASGARRDADSLFMAQADYALGRDRAVLAALDDERLASAPLGLALKAMALTRLGGHKAAAALFAATSPAGLWPSLAADYHLACAEAALETGDSEAARAALRMAGGSASHARQQGLRALLQARLTMTETGDDSGLRAIVAEAAGPAAARAGLDLLAESHRRGDTDDRSALEAAQRLSLQWRGGAAERESLTHIAGFARDTDPATAFGALRRLADLHAESDAAGKARTALTSMLVALGARDDLSPGEMAQLFYENLDFAPPGREGDVLIRDVAARLAALDLLGPASELLHHQAFNRLRGAERAHVAADLAALYLDDQRPAEALRTIRATRFAALDPALNQRRLLLEAEALSLAVSGEAGLALLQEADGEGALHLRADILWRNRDWAGAGAAYRDVLSIAGDPLAADARRYALRAGAALLKAGDKAGFRSFRREMKEKLAGSPEGALLDGIDAERGVGPTFMEAYRRAFERTGAEG